MPLRGCRAARKVDKPCQSIEQGYVTCPRTSGSDAGLCEQLVGCPTRRGHLTKSRSYEIRKEYEIPSCKEGGRVRWTRLRKRLSMENLLGSAGCPISHRKKLVEVYAIARDKLAKQTTNLGHSRKSLACLNECSRLSGMQVCTTQLLKSFTTFHIPTKEERR